jgi:hypothetical protein
MLEWITQIRALKFSSVGKDSSEFASRRNMQQPMSDKNLRTDKQTASDGSNAAAAER